MGLFESLAQLSKTLLTIDAELKHLREALNETRQEVQGLISDMQEVRERLARLEASRDADRAQMQVERSEIPIYRGRPGAIPSGSGTSGVEIDTIAADAR